MDGDHDDLYAILSLKTGETREEKEGITSDEGRQRSRAVKKNPSPEAKHL